MRGFGKTDRGLCREINQDSFSFCQISDTLCYAVLCDGMGGENGGNVASELTVRDIGRELSAALGSDAEQKDLRTIMEQAISHANLVVNRAARDTEALRGMGTTVVLAVAEGNTVTIAHAGDSRAYLIHGEELSQLTHDHTVVQMLMERGEITEEEDGTFRILTSDGSMYITAGEDTGLSSYVEGESFQLSDLKAGDRIMAWYEIVLTSYPGQTYAYHLMLLPDETEAESEDGAPAEGTQISLELNGEASELVGRYEGGTVMVPVAAVAQTLGFDVTYIPGKDGAADQVLVESEAFQVQLTIGSNLIVGVTRIPDAVGMTAPQDYGKAPYIVEPGTTWAPAQLFEMLGKTVSLEGTHLTIA